MPDEIRNAPGYTPFTLGPDAQAWVDSMAEIADGGDAVYGRPKPVVAPHHRSLATAPPPAPPPTYASSPPPSYPPDQSWPPPVILTIPPLQPTWPPAQRRHPGMPDIEEAAPPPRTLPRRVMMPDIGDGESSASSDAQRADRAPAAPPHRAMPDIDGESAPATPVIPDIGDEPAPRRRSMPDIAEEEDTPSPRHRMPDIG